MVAMFAPSLVTGHLVRMLGAPFLELLGAALIAAGAGVVLSGRDEGGDEGGDSTPSIAAFAASQALTGCGWNLCFVSATATLQPQPRPRVCPSTLRLPWGSSALRVPCATLYITLLHLRW